STVALRGGFELPVPDWARRTTVLLAARKPGLRPHSEVVEIGPSRLEQETDLVLGVGYAIEGQVVERGRPLRNAHVSIDVAFGTPGIFGVGGQAWWTAGRLEEKHASTRTDADGRFSLRGLAPIEHRLSIEPDLLGVSGLVGRNVQVLAPDFRTYDMTPAQLRISVTGEGAAVEGARVRVSANDRSIEFTSAIEVETVSVAANSPITITSSLPTARTATLELGPFAAGSTQDVVLPLEILARPSLTAIIVGATEAGVRRAKVRLSREGHPGDTELVLTATGARDTFRVDTVPLDPGACTATLWPLPAVAPDVAFRSTFDPDELDGPGRYLAPQVAEVVLPERGDASVQFPMTLYGRLHVRYVKAGSWSMTWRVVDDQGRTLLVGNRQQIASGVVGLGDGEFVESATSSSFAVESGGDTGPQSDDLGGAARRSGVIPPGEHTLVVDSPGHERWTERVSIEAGRTTTVSVELIEAERTPK
ncbi:MAG: PEGA domain-containing protein, partial [Planctomycetota bacterium]